MKKFRFPSFTKSTVIIVGGYGSGKSEVAINLSSFLVSSQSEKVAIADLDIVNPYFRSREAAARLNELGVRSLCPAGGQFYADLPVILPEIKGAIEGFKGKLILDVGGDDTGARVLGSLASSFVPGSYELFLVLNANRPFTADVAGCLKMISDIEKASRLKFTGIISNTHLLDDSTVQIVMNGFVLAQQVSEDSGLPVVFLSASSELVEELDTKQINIPVLPLDRKLLKPWEREAGSGDNR